MWKQQGFGEWTELLTYLGSIPGFDIGGFGFSGKKWSAYYKLSKKAEISFIVIYGEGEKDGLVRLPRCIAVYAEIGGKLKRKIIFGKAAFVSNALKMGRLRSAAALKSFHQSSLVGKAHCKREVKKLEAEIAEELDLDEIEEDVGGDERPSAWK